MALMRLVDLNEGPPARRDFSVPVVQVLVVVCNRGQLPCVYVGVYAASALRRSTRSVQVLLDRSVGAHSCTGEFLMFLLLVLFPLRASTSAF